MTYTFLSNVVGTAMAIVFHRVLSRVNNLEALKLRTWWFHRSLPIDSRVHRLIYYMEFSFNVGTLHISTRRFTIRVPLHKSMSFYSSLFGDNDTVKVEFDRQVSQMIC